MKTALPPLARRHVLFAAAGLSGAGLAMPLVARSGRFRLDLTNPQVALDSYVKLRGSIVDETVFQYYEGDIYALINDNVPTPLAGFRGIQKSAWRPDGTGGYINRDFDLGFYTDYKTREIIDEWVNPITGKALKVHHYRGGPTGGHFRRDADPGDVYGGLKNGHWSVVGNQIWQSSSSYGERPNPLSIEEWPLASTGPKLLGVMTTAFSGRLDEVANPEISMAPSTQIWTNTTSWMPWMEMGQLPGFNEWRWVGAKGVNPSDLDPVLVEAAEKVWPGYVTRDTGWAVPVSGREDYVSDKLGLPRSQ